MKILLVEDDENKRGRIIEFIESTLQPATIDVARSLQAGMRSIVQSTYDLIILDMSMPTFDIGPEEPGGRFQAFGGREILRRMERHHCDSMVVVVTQFDRFGEGQDTVTLEALDGQLRRDHPRIYAGSVYYNVALEGWKEQLVEHLVVALERRGSNA